MSETASLMASEISDEVNSTDKSSNKTIPFKAANDDHQHKFQARMRLHHLCTAHAIVNERQAPWHVLYDETVVRKGHA